jgi:hypothetical protein
MYPGLHFKFLFLDAQIQINIHMERKSKPKGDGGAFEFEFELDDSSTSTANLKKHSITFLEHDTRTSRSSMVPVMREWKKDRLGRHCLVAVPTSTKEKHANNHRKERIFTWASWSKSSVSWTCRQRGHFFFQ